MGNFFGGKKTRLLTCELFLCCLFLLFIIILKTNQRPHSISKVPLLFLQLVATIVQLMCPRSVLDRLGLFAT